MRDTHVDPLTALEEALSPTPDEVAALIEGSLEADRETPESYALLSQLPSPSVAEVKALKEVVIVSMDRPPATRASLWLPLAIVAIGAIGALALLLL